MKIQLGNILYILYSVLILIVLPLEIKYRENVI